MLLPALMYKQQLDEAVLRTAIDPKYKFNHLRSYQSFSLTLEADTWSRIQLVSVKDSILLGYMSAAIDRQTNSVESICLTGFQEQLSIEFIQDINKFVIDLLTVSNFNKVVWSVIVGNPAELIWDRVCSRLGGRIVGVFKENVKLSDNKLYDGKFYEVMRCDYLNTVNG